MQDTVYDLGDIDSSPSQDDERERPSRPAARSFLDDVEATPREQPRASAARRPVPDAGNPFDLGATLSVLVPGSGHLVRRDFASGMFFVTWTGLAVALFAAVLETLPGLSETIGLLGGRPEAAVWTLGILTGVVAFLHVASVATCPSEVPGSPHPAVAGTASALFPGWGQALNGDRGRAVAFVVVLWGAAFAWLLHAPPTASLLESRGLVLPPALVAWSSPVVRWTIPAVLWSLAIYDAVTRARRT